MRRKDRRCPVRTPIFRVALGVLCAAMGLAGDVLTTVSQVQGLNPSEAARGLPVRLNGVVTYSDPEWGLLFVEDSTGALFVSTKGLGIGAPAGAEVEIDARTAPGDLGPVAAALHLRVSGRGSARVMAASVKELDAGQFDSRLVETRGVVRPVRAFTNRVTFQLQEGDASLRVVAPVEDKGVSRRLVDAVVRVRGVNGSLIENGKRFGSQLFVSSLDDIVVETAPPGEVKTVVIGPGLESLAIQPLAHRVKVTGEVTLRQEKQIWVEGESGGVAVLSEREPAASVGDRVTVTGFPTRWRQDAVLANAQIAIDRRSASQIVAKPLSSVCETPGHGRLVRLRGRVMEHSRDGMWIACGGRRVAVELPGQAGAELPQGADVEVTGVARAIPGQTAFSIVSRETKVLPHSEFLNREYVLVLVALVSLAGAGVLIWLSLLRGTVRRQTAVIRARLEREAQLESEYRRLVERNLAGVFRWRPGGAIVDCNPAFAQMLGYGARQELLGRSYWELEVESSGREALQRLAAGESIANREVSLRRRTGELLWLIENICLVETPEGALFEATAINVTEQRRYREELQAARDQLEQRVLERTADLENEIAERRRVEQELLAAKQEAEKMSRAKSSFLANMSHELRTPLNAVIGYSEILTEDAEATGMKSFLPDLERIRGAARHLLTLISDVLDLSKIEAGRMEIHQESFPVAHMVEDVLATVEPIARKTRNQLRADYSRGPAEQTADPTRFRQSLLNLLTNACKFTDGGEVRLTVERVNADGAEWVEWAVTDNGIGIAPEHQDKLFQSFSQVDATTTRKFSGTGLGLVISKRYCQLMGGDITFSSEAGRGSRFVIRMPSFPTTSGIRNGTSEPSASGEPNSRYS